jgi:hypothetical protein
MSVELVGDSPAPPADHDKDWRLDSSIYDLRNMASIAADLTCDADCRSATDEERNLAVFTVYQTAKMAKELVTEYHRHLKQAQKA